MSKTYRPYEPDQVVLLPPALAEWLPETHLVYFLRDVVEGLDLRAITTAYERDERGDERPAERARREPRWATIREATTALEQAAREAAAAQQRAQTARTAAGPRRGRPPPPPDPTPAPKAQRTFTDPESRSRPASGEKTPFVQGDHCQAVVDAKGPVIVAADVTQATNDNQQAGPMRAQVDANTGRRPKRASLDAGYFSPDTVQTVSEGGIEVFMPPDRPPHGAPSPAAPRGRIPAGRSVADRMRRTLRTKRGRAIDAPRNAIVEPVFGQIKPARGFRQFLLRGGEQGRAEGALICTGHNLLKLWKAAPA